MPTPAVHTSLYLVVLSVTLYDACCTFMINVVPQSDNSVPADDVAIHVAASCVVHDDGQVLGGQEALLEAHYVRLCANQGAI